MFSPHEPLAADSGQAQQDGHDLSLTSVPGSVLLSEILKIYSIFAPFLLLTGILALIASGLLFLPRNPEVDESPLADDAERTFGRPRLERDAGKPMTSAIRNRPNAKMLLS
jgi:hypothetical protein